MMKLSLLLALCAAPTTISAFASKKMTVSPRADVQLAMTSRREVLIGVAASAGFGALAPAFALDTIPADNEILKEQRTVTDRLDINNAPVADYMQLPGMYPGIGGKIANSGPYASVRDVYRSKLFSKDEVATIKKYAKYLTATKPTGLDTMRGRDPYRGSFNVDRK
jgi:hypothetical protein